MESLCLVPQTTKNVPFFFLRRGRVCGRLSFHPITLFIYSFYCKSDLCTNACIVDLKCVNFLYVIVDRVNMYNQLLFDQESRKTYVSWLLFVSLMSVLCNSRTWPFLLDLSASQYSAMTVGLRGLDINRF